MNFKNIIVLVVLAVATFTSCSDDEETLTEGINITMRNTLQDPGEVEKTYPSLFGLADSAFDEFATFSNSSTEFTGALGQTGTPFGDINGLYEIEFTESTIEFKLLPDSNDPFWPMQFGTFPAGKFDRYYFTLSKAHNISSSNSSNENVKLRIDSENVIVVELSEGYDFNPGTSFKIDIE